MNKKTGEFVDSKESPDWEPGYEAPITAGGDYQPYLESLRVAETETGGQAYQKPEVTSIGDVLVGSFTSAIDAFFAAAATGSIKDAMYAGFAALGQSLAQGINIMIQEAMPGPGGQILGTIGGGLIGMAFGRIFKSKARKTEKVPVLAEVTNWPDPFKAWTLPTSRYLNPNSWNSGNGGFTQNNNISITGTPKLASKVQRALTEPQFLRQAQRRNV